MLPHHRRVLVAVSAVAASLSGLVLVAAPAPAAEPPCVVDRLLVNSCRPWVGATSHAYGQTSFRAHIEHHEARAGRPMEIVHDYLQPGEILDSTQRYFARREDTILLVNWKLVDTWASAAGGDATVDAYIDRMADAVNALGDTRIMLVPWHEPEDNVSAGGAPGCGTKSLRGRAGSAADYRAMWHNVRARFDAKGVDNVVWVLNYMGWTNWYCMTRDLWPGNDYVDWVMWDPYPNNTTWRNFVGSFYSYLEQSTDAEHAFTSKPWGIAEYGYKGTSQTAAYQMYRDIRANVDRFSRLKAYVSWDARNAQTGVDQRVLYTASGVLDQQEQDAYTTLVNDPLFTMPLTPPDVTPPEIPAALAATAEPARVALTWEAATDDTAVTGYRIYRDATLLGLTADTSFADTGVVPGSTHSYAVSALDAAGNESALSEAVEVTVPEPLPDVTAPGVPLDVTASGLDGPTSVVAVGWGAATDDRGIGAYTVTRDGEPVATLDANSRMFLDSGVAEGQSYTYAVFATDTSGNPGPASDGVVVTAPVPDRSAPSTPTDLTATVLDGDDPAVTLTWTASEDDRAVGSYSIVRDGVLLDTVPGTATGWTDSTVEHDTTYSYVVLAHDGAGNSSDPSDPASASVPAPAVDTTPPTAPGTPTVTLSGLVPQVSWAAATDASGVATYDVFRGATLVGTTAGTTFADTTAPANATVTYTVRAVDAAGNVGPASGPASVAVPRDTTAPSRTDGLTAVAGATGTRTITVSWSAATDNHRVGSYWLYRGNAKYRQLSGTTLMFTDTGLTAGTRYTYKVYALDASNNWGPASTSVSAVAR